MQLCALVFGALDGARYNNILFVLSENRSGCQSGVSCVRSGVHGDQPRAPAMDRRMG